MKELAFHQYLLFISVKKKIRYTLMEYEKKTRGEKDDFVRVGKLTV